MSPGPCNIRRKKQIPSPPSSHILAALAAIAAAATPTNANAAPPSFLCPSLSQPHLPRTQLLPPDAFVRAFRDRSSWRHLPDKYEFKDGVWRRVDSWSLYGATICVSCGEVDSTSFPPPASGTTQPTPTIASPTYDIRDTLPRGWRPKDPPGAARITIILGLSLVLSILISILVVACVFWRRSIRRRREKDLEKRAMKRLRTLQSDDSLSIISGKEHKVKQKLWARATSRWKSNARYTARLRRGRRSALGHPVLHLSTPPPLDSVPDVSQEAPEAEQPSPTPFHHSAFSSMYAEQPPTTPPSPTTSLHETNADILRRVSTLSNSTFSLASLPAYQHPPSHILIQKENSEEAGPSSFSGVISPTQPPSIDMAHVATDDKRLLSRLADLASAPPIEAESSLHSSNIAVSAPVWDDDDDDDDLGEYLRNSNGPHSFDRTSDPSRRATIFPPPPSKSMMVLSYHGRRYSLEDFSLESPIEPSAPPFEEANCPEFDSDLGPSAPPLALLEDASAPSDEYGSPAAIQADGDRTESRICPLSASVDNSVYRPPSRTQSDKDP